MNLRPSFCFLLLFSFFLCRAQEKWDLRQCVAYALDHNISIRQQDVQARITALQYQQSRLSQYPSAGFTGNSGYSSGRNQNPVTFDLITTGYVFSSLNLQASLDVYNFGSKKNSLQANKWEAMAALANVEKLKNDLALNIAGAYLQALLARQQDSLSVIQLQQTRAQLENTRKLVAAGSLPELNAVQLEAQLANDSANLITARGNNAQYLLQLKAYLGLDAGQPFDIATPHVESIPLEDLAALQPEAVYQSAVQNLPQQRANDLRLKAASRFIAAAQGALYPSLSVYGTLGTSFNNQAKQVAGTTPVIAPVGSVTVGGAQYEVFPLQPINTYSYSKQPYFGQLNQNFRQSAGISISVPIANGGVLRTAYERARLNYKNLELQKELDNQNLKQDIYRAYNDVITSLQKFSATTKTVEANEKAFDFAIKRYNIGLLNTLDLITTQNNLFSARLQRLVAQFDYVFKMKVLEFYKGQGLKL